MQPWRNAGQLVGANPAPEFPNLFDQLLPRQVGQIFVHLLPRESAPLRRRFLPRCGIGIRSADLHVILWVLQGPKPKP